MSQPVENELVPGTKLLPPGDLPGQGKLFMGGRPVPPVMGMQEYSSTGTLLRRTNKQFEKYTLATRRWMAQCLLAEIALEEDKQAAAHDNQAI